MTSVPLLNMSNCNYLPWTTVGFARQALIAAMVRVKSSLSSMPSMSAP